MMILTAEQMKHAEKTASEQGLSYLCMMDNAGSSAARWIVKNLTLAQEGKTIVLCGSGNNGGDGFVVARCLAQQGYDVAVILACGQPTSPLAVEMISYLRDYSVPVVDATEQFALAKIMVYEGDLFVDAVFGTGFHGELPPTVFQLFSCVKELEKPVIALDLPSGVSADQGSVAKNTLACYATVTFHAFKFAHVIFPAKEYCGIVHVADIGIPKTQATSFIIDKEYVKQRLQRPLDNTHKGTFGSASMFVGSQGMSGAATFAAAACARCGVGLVKPVVHESIYPLVATAVPEGVYTLYQDQTSAGVVAESCKKSNACLVGCGSGKSPLVRDVLGELVSSYPFSLVIDADGINSLRSHINMVKERKGETVLTPHPGEMARLLGKTIEEVQANRLEIAKKVASKYDVVVVLKGAGTIIADPLGKVAIANVGNSGLSKGGSGDVLAGMITSFCAQGLSAFESACVGVWLHGKAGELASCKYSRRGMLPSDVIQSLPDLFLELESE